MSDRDARDAKRFGDALTLLEHRLPNGVRLVAAALVGDTAGVAAWVDEREGSDAVPTTGELEAIARHEKEKRDAIRREAFEEAAAIVESGADRVSEVTRMALLARASCIRALAAPAKEATPATDCVACAMVAARRARGDNDYCCVLHDAKEATVRCDCCPQPAVHFDVWAQGDGRGEPCCGGTHCGVVLNAKDGTSNFTTRPLDAKGGADGR